jgi:putative ABC transport system ATP-binding protein
LVTHDPNAAAYADRVIFLLDGGRLVHELVDPTPEELLDTLKSLDLVAAPTTDSDAGP